jgi:DNA-binding GntR family transcriptional regulator
MSEQLAAVPRSFLRDQAYARLREAIITGALAPGQTIVIDELARQMDLSTMPVREALAWLVRDGLVESLPRRAHRVSPMSESDAMALADVVATVTVRVYALGAPNVDAEGIATMQVCIEEHDEAMAAGDLERAIRAVEAFHGVVFAACRNPEYQRLLDSLVPRWERIMLTALRNGDPSGAVAAVHATWAAFADELLHQQPA